MSSYQSYQDEESYDDASYESREYWSESYQDYGDPRTPTQSGSHPLPIIAITPSDEPSAGSSSKRSSHKMSSRGSKSKSSSGSKKHSSPSSKQAKSDDWTDVTDAEERRRIQNRIAQRKFREKAREQKERAERDARNQENAGSSYQVPHPEDLAEEEDLSGLPWGPGPSLRYVVRRGHETASQQGSRRASDQMVDEQQYLATYVDSSYPYHTGGWDSRDSSGGSPYYDYYDTGSNH